ncbi:hypothetical protein HDU98_006411 [Podochytrium sp. JEL0797]|nr:hypothetical protein HDU98_006411 [Podochytrium sp. JEL0797]
MTTSLVFPPASDTLLFSDMLDFTSHDILNDLSAFDFLDCSPLFDHLESPSSSHTLVIQHPESNLSAKSDVVMDSFVALTSVSAGGGVDNGQIAERVLGCGTLEYQLFLEFRQHQRRQEEMLLEMLVKEQEVEDQVNGFEDFLV